MVLKVIGSSSKGNAYLLENNREALMLECGVRFTKIKKALDFNISKVAGCLVTHEHQDHGGAAGEVIKAGVNLYASAGTLEAIGVEKSHRARVLKEKVKINIGAFQVLPFGVKHDAAEPLGFLINHPETGVILFVTDTYYLPHTFAGLNHIISEVNYDARILEDNVLNGRIPAIVRKRVIRSHMELQTFKGFLVANDLSGVINIVLIHLSDGNSDADLFTREVEQLTGKRAYIAEPGMELNFNKTPF